MEVTRFVHKCSSRVWESAFTLQTDSKSKMAVMGSYWLWHFRFISRTNACEVTRLDRIVLLQVLKKCSYFSLRIGIQDGRPCFWFAEWFFISREQLHTNSTYLPVNIPLEIQKKKKYCYFLD